MATAGAGTGPSAPITPVYDSHCSLGAPVVRTVKVENFPAMVKLLPVYGDAPATIGEISFEGRRLCIQCSQETAESNQYASLLTPETLVRFNLLEKFKPDRGYERRSGWLIAAEMGVETSAAGRADMYLPKDCRADEDYDHNDDPWPRQKKLEGQIEAQPVRFEAFTLSEDPYKDEPAHFHNYEPDCRWVRTSIEGNASEVKFELGCHDSDRICLDDNGNLIITLRISAASQLHLSQSQENTAQFHSDTHLLKDMALLMAGTSAPHDLELRAESADGNEGDGGTVPCHKLVVMARSPVLNAMIKECAPPAGGGLVKITAPGLTVQQLKTLVAYLYVGSEAIERPTEWGHLDLQHLLDVANRFEVTGLRELCISLLQETLTDENVPELLVFASRMSIENLRDRCMQHFAGNLTAMLDSANYSKYKGAIGDECLLEIVKMRESRKRKSPEPSEPGAV